MKGDTGKIRYRARASQQIDFSGVRFGNATPSDIDGVLEIGGKFFAFLEYKHLSAAPISYGQKTALGQICKAIDWGERTSIAIIGMHDADCSEDIDGSNAKAIEIWWRGEWRDVAKQNRTVMDFVESAYHYTFKGP